MTTDKKIFVLPGWAYETKKWDEFIGMLRKDGFNPILLSIPGLTEKIEKPWNIDDYVNWLSSKLKNESQVFLIGHSNGGRIALSYILSNPKKISKLVLLDSAGIYHNEVPIRLKRTLFKYLAKLGKSVTKSDTLKNLMYKFARESDYNQAPEIMKKTMQNLISHDLTQNLQKIRTNTLILWGHDDKVTPLSDGKMMEKNLPNSRLEIVKDARHSPQFSHTENVVKIIDEFFKK
ncbi:alpha/beta hydrolase [Candidatus Microgenomates bacterium]|nr:alpha/beta hydrolase [Candidatus Microgenomates bacterium]